MPNNRKEVGVPAPIKEPATKAVWNPEMATEVDRLVSTKMTRFLKKRNIPRGENQYTPDWWWISDQTRQFMKD